MSYRTLNPATGELVESFDTLAGDQLETALDRAARAALAWRETPLDRRATLLRAVADALEERAAEWGRLMAVEMGKPVTQGEGEAKKCAWVCRYYAENGARFLEPRSHESDGSEAFVRYDPIGPVLAIMPWNFPFWQVFRFGAPALMAGNTVILKHAPNTPRCGAEIAELVTEAGAPEGVFQNLYLTNDQAAEAIAHRAVGGVTLTGSTGAGREVASTAGRQLKPMVMELGGSDPFIVFADADVDEAAKVGVESRCLNSGQSCIAAKRFLVEHSVYDRFAEAFVERMEAKKVGDPLDREVEVGPLAREDLRDDLARQVAESRDAGARVLCGGEAPGGDGFYYPPTVLADVPEDAPAYRQELFGPVASLFPFDGEDEAVEIANGTVYGLGASLWTGDRARADRLIPRLDTGSVFVNGMVKSDPRLPFGGVKDSGFGRELSREGMLEFVNQKTVWIK